MRRILLLAACLLFVNPAAAHGTVTGTSSTGDIDTWGIYNNVPCPAHPDNHPDPVHIDVSDSWSIRNLGEVLEDTCLVQMCTADIYWFTVRLELLDPSPGDAVAMHVVGDMPGFSDSLSGVAVSDQPDLNSLQTYPSAVATYDDPVAEVTIQLGGCNRATTVIVEGIVVDGEVDYTLTF